MLYVVLNRYLDAFKYFNSCVWIFNSTYTKQEDQFNLQGDPAVIKQMMRSLNLYSTGYCAVDIFN